MKVNAQTVALKCHLSITAC